MGDWTLEDLSSKLENNMRFILSSGRTGTLFLAHRLAARFPHLVCAHEPSPSRLELLLANFRNRYGAGHALLQRLFVTVRKRRLAQLTPGQAYLEINPLLCPLTDLVARIHPLHVIHLIRDPISWATSIVHFKAAGWRKLVIDYTPLAKPYPYPYPSGWQKLGEFERALWRWRYCNENILRLQSACQHYVRIRYEDLFTENLDQQAEALGLLLDGLDLDSHGDLAWLQAQQRINASRQDTALVPATSSSHVHSICGDLMSQFGYTHG
jgi:hypothetical protein